MYCMQCMPKYMPMFMGTTLTLTTYNTHGHGAGRSDYINV